MGRLVRRAVLGQAAELVLAGRCKSGDLLRIELRSDFTPSNFGFDVSDEEEIAMHALELTVVSGAAQPEADTAAAATETAALSTAHPKLSVDKTCDSDDSVQRP